MCFILKFYHKFIVFAFGIFLLVIQVISKIHIYFLVTSDIYDAVYRIEQLKRIGIKVIYAQAEQNPSLGITPNRAMKEFACRYIYGRLYFKETWEQYCGRHGFPPYDGDLGNVPRKSGKASG